MIDRTRAQTVIVIIIFRIVYLTLNGEIIVVVQKLEELYQNLESL